MIGFEKRPTNAANGYLIVGLSSEYNDASSWLVAA